MTAIIAKCPIKCQVNANGEVGLKFGNLIDEYRHRWQV